MPEDHATAAQDTGRMDAPAAETDLIVGRIRLRALRRASWLERLWDGGTVTHAAMGLDGRDTVALEADWYRSDADMVRIGREIDAVDRRLAAADGRLRRIAELFSLTQTDVDMLTGCLAPMIEPALGPVFAHLHGWPYPTDALVARLFGHAPSRGPLWSPGGPAALWRLVTAGMARPGEPTPLICDPQVVHWLAGDLRLDPELVGVVRTLPVHAPLAGWPVAEIAAQVPTVRETGCGLRLLLDGPPGSGRRSCAAAIAAHLGLKALSVDTGAIADENWPEVYIRAQRLAHLAGVALVWHGPGVARPWPGTVPPVPLHILAVDEEAAGPPAPDGLVDERMVLPPLPRPERERLWAGYVPHRAVWNPSAKATLIDRYRLTVGDIAAIGRRSPSGPEAAADLACSLTRQGLGELGHLTDCPFEWADLVLPQTLVEALCEFAFEARERQAFWEGLPARDLFRREQGLVGLLSGPPGTGKTMAAQVITRDLGLDLFRVDLSSVVSKYIGETAKNLQRIFTRAKRMNAVLLFDEADALFGKRTDVKDAHDRYANTDTNHLLQLLEDHSGVALLATNRKENVDPAFIRRMHMVFDFPRPEAAERRALWHRMVSALAGEPTARALAEPLSILADSVEVSGAQIKKSALAGVFVARRRRQPLGPADLLRGIDRELAKEGRSLGARERQRILRHA